MIVLDLVVSYYSAARSSTLTLCSIIELLVVFRNFIFVIIVYFAEYFLPLRLIILHVSEIPCIFLLLCDILRFVQNFSRLRVDLGE